MEGFWPIIIVIVVSIISSIIKKAKAEAVEKRQTTHFDSKGRPITNKPQSAKPAGLSDLLKEFQKLKEMAEQNPNQPHKFPTPATVSASNRFPEPVENSYEMEKDEVFQENEPMSGAVSMEDRISVRERALEEFVDEDHPIFKGAGKAAESRVNKSTGLGDKIMKDMFSKENIIRGIIMNEAVLAKKQY